MAKRKPSNRKPRKKKPESAEKIARDLKRLRALEKAKLTEKEEAYQAVRDAYFQEKEQYDELLSEGYSKKDLGPPPKLPPPPDAPYGHYDFCNDAERMRAIEQIYEDYLRLQEELLNKGDAQASSNIRLLMTFTNDSGTPTYKLFHSLTKFEHFLQGSPQYQTATPIDWSPNGLCAYGKRITMGVTIFRKDKDGNDKLVGFDSKHPILNYYGI